jgi:hypothetical protein
MNSFFRSGLRLGAGIKLIGLALAASIAIGIRLVATAKQARLFTIKFGYVSIAITGFLLFVLLARFLWSQWKLGRLARYKHGALLSLAAAAFLQLHEPHRFKVLFDEFTISAVARNMHFVRQATFPVSAHVMNNRLYVTENGIDKRPVFFAFVVALVHDFTGYRPENVFFVNGIACFLLLFFFYGIGRHYGGPWLGSLLVALAAGFPLLAQNVTGGGYDLFNLMMIGLLIAAAVAYLKSDRSEAMDFLVITAVALAQVRYESILYLVAVAGIVVVKWVRDREVKLTWVAAASPLLLTAPLLLNKIFFSNPGFLQTKPDQEFFSLNYLSDNLAHGLVYLFQFSQDGTNSLLLTILGLLAFVFFAFYVVRNGRKIFLQGSDVVLVAVFSIVCVNTGIALCHFWGQWDDPAATRFSLPLHFLFIVALARVMKEFLKGRDLPASIVVPIGALSLILGISPAVQHFATREMVSSDEHTWLIDSLKKNPQAHILAIADSSLGPILYNNPAISNELAAVHKWQINECIKRHVYDEIWVLERFSIDHATLKEMPYSGKALDDDFVREKVAELWLRPNVVARISRIVRVEGKNAIPPESFTKAAPPFPDMDSYVKYLYSMYP